jgi:hypothetical protein
VKVQKISGRMALRKNRMRAGAASVLLVSGLVLTAGVGTRQPLANAQTTNGSAATLRLLVNVRQPWGVGTIYPEVFCRDAGSQFGGYTTASQVERQVTPNTSCRLNMVDANVGVQSRVGRTSFRSTINGVTTVLPLFRGFYLIPMGAAGTITNAQFDFDFDLANPLDVALDLFEPGGSQPWSTWFGSSTVAAAGFFSGPHRVLDVRASTDFRTAKRAIWLAGQGSKFDLYLGLLGFTGSASVQYFDISSTKVGEQTLALTPSTIGFRGSFVSTTITTPPKTAFMIVGLSSQEDFGVDAFRLTRVSASPPTTTTIASTTLPTTTTTRPATTTVSPTTTTRPSTTSTTPGAKIATSIAWSLVPLGCGANLPCTGYRGLVADAAGNLITPSLVAPPEVQTTTTQVKPGFLKVSASYAGNATYGPSSATREIRIPQAAIQIVGGAIEGVPLQVRVSLTDPETGAPTKALVTSVVITSTTPGGPGTGTTGSVVDGAATFTLGGLRAGDYNVTVRVPDTIGFVLFTNFTLPLRISTSGASTTTVPPTSTPPTTTPGTSTKTISSPVNNSVVSSAVKMQINEASNVARVDWFLNGVTIGSDITPADPMTFNAQGWGPGPFTLKAVIVDGAFQQTTTRTVSFSVG